MGDITLYTIVDESCAARPYCIIGHGKLVRKVEFFMRNASYVMMDANPELPGVHPFERRFW